MMIKLRDHSEQVEFVRTRDGDVSALAYAIQSLSVYRKAARRLPNGKNTFAHAMPYRPHYVASIIYLRNFIRRENSKVSIL